MNYDLFLRGERIPPDAGTIATAFEFLIRDKKARTWAVKTVAKLVDPANTKVTQKQIDAFLSQLVERQLSNVRAIIEFVPIEQIIGDIEKAENQEITNAVLATATSAFAQELGDSFIIGDNSITVNPDSPPTIEQCYGIFGRLAGMRNTATQLGEYTTWSLGAFIDACECYYGEDFNLTQVVKQTEYAYNTIVICLRVFREYGHERFNLPYTMHKEALFSKLPKEQQVKALQLAEKHQLSCGQFRKVLSYAKHAEEGIDHLSDEAKEDPDKLMEAVASRAGARRFIFYLEGEVMFYKGHASELPGNAAKVIDLGLKAWINHEDPDSPPKPIKDWKVPVIDVEATSDDKSPEAPTSDAKKETPTE